MPLFQSYRQWAESIAPQVRSGLRGQLDVPPQPPFTEAWITFALFWKKTPSSLEEVIFQADAVDHAIPNPDEIVWAFLRLKKRGWLSETGDSYALTPDGYRAVEEIVGEGGVYERIRHLEAWTLAHPV